MNNNKLTTSKSLKGLLLGVLCILIAAFAVGCASSEAQKGGPTFASSSSESYAASYPDRVEKMGTRQGEGDAKLKETVVKFEGYPDALEDPDWVVVMEITKEADAAGKNREIDEMMQRQASTSEFVEEHVADISRRVGRSVDGEAKSAGAKKYESRKTVRYSLPRVIEKQKEDETKTIHEAHQLIVAHTDTLGKSNVKALEIQVNEITEASHYVFIELEREREELKERVEESKGVSETLDSGSKRHEEALSKDGLSASMKTFHQGRLDALKGAKERMKKTDEVLKKREEKLDKEVEKAQESYQKAYDKLIETIEKKIEEAEAAAGK